MNASEILFTLL